MKKKICITLLVVVMLVPSFAFAKMFDIGLGATTQVRMDYNNFDFEDTFGELNSYSFGAELRLKLTILELDATAVYDPWKFGDATFHVIHFMPTAGLSFDIADIVRIGLGMGPDMFWLVGDNAPPQPNFGDKFMDSKFFYRATVGFMLGPVMLDVNYAVPTDGFNIRTHEAEKLKPNFETGRLGLSVIYNFF